MVAISEKELSMLFLALLALALLLCSSGAVLQKNDHIVLRQVERCIRGAHNPL